jgi:dTDP-4-dehydrorhamnose 3,5-epimerase
MTFSKTRIDGAFVIRPQRFEDERGFFARTYCAREFAEQGLEPEVVQRSISYNKLRGTLRGMHFQSAPHEETKVVSCARGSIYDVIIDLRPGSPSFRLWFGATLSADAYDSLYVPKGCAHGFITLADDTLVVYEMSVFHHAASARGLRFDDPAFGVKWPLAPSVISARDLGYPRYPGP